MLDRGNIISASLLWLGNTIDFNDNMSEEYMVAEVLMNTVIEEVLMNTRLLFNSVTVQLTRVDEDETKYNMPALFCNHIGPGDVRIEGPFVYTENGGMFQYCKRVDLDIFPDYLFLYLKYLLCSQMTDAYSQYRDRKEGALMEINTELLKIQVNEIHEMNWLGDFYVDNL